MSDAAILMKYDANKKSTAVAYLLLIFIGAFGAHRFYLNQTGTAIALLLITLSSLLLMLVLIGFFTIWISWLWVLVDLFLVPGLVRNHNNKLAQELGVVTPAV